MDHSKNRPETPETIDASHEARCDGVSLPSADEFARLLENDTSVSSVAAEANYTIYHKYSRGS